MKLILGSVMIELVGYPVKPGHGQPYIRFGDLAFGTYLGAADKKRHAEVLYLMSKRMLSAYKPVKIALRKKGKKNG